MIRRLSALALLLMVVQAWAAPPTIRDLVSLDQIRDLALSPDQTQLVYTLRQTDIDADRVYDALWLLDLSSQKARPLTDLRGDAHRAQWSRNSDALYFLSKRSGSRQIWRLPMGGGEAQAVTQLAQAVQHFRLSPDGTRLALLLRVHPDCADLECSLRKDRQQQTGNGRVYQRWPPRHWNQWHDGKRSQLFVSKLGPDGRASEPLLLSSGIDADIPPRQFASSAEIAWSSDSKEIYFSAINPAPASSYNLDIYRVPADGRRAAENLTRDNPAADRAPQPSADGRSLYYLATQRPGHESDRYRLMQRDLRLGSVREITADWDFSPDALRLQDDFALLRAHDAGVHRLFRIALQGGDIAALGDARSVGEFVAADNTIIAVSHALDQPGELVSIGPTPEEAVRSIAPAPSNKAPLNWSPFESFAFSGWNDQSVQGHLVYPAGFDAQQKYPVLLMIHGGPQSSMGNAFRRRWNPQLFAAQGFAVLFFDIHGSLGYGQAFTDSVSGDWGGKPLQDLQRGWKFALENYPFLDADRACAMGASYGGYLIQWIASQWPDAFGCLVSHAGVLDTRSMHLSTDEAWFVDWEFGGPPWSAQELMAAQNPVEQLQKWRTPMLLSHGARDYRVPVEQSLASFNALQRRGIQSRLLIFEQEGHWISSPQNQWQWQQEILRWLKRWTSSNTSP